MVGETRRKEILKYISESDKPVSGTKLAELFHVSRQVIVQDIALLRAVNKNILSTNKGYVLYVHNRLPQLKASVNVPEAVKVSPFTTLLLFVVLT